VARRILLALGTCAALLYGLRAVRRAFVTIEVAGESMQPTLEAGEFLIVRRGIPRDPAGRIAYLHAEDGRPLLKRIVGLPGESLRAGSHVEVNGQATGPYAVQQLHAAVANGQVNATTLVWTAGMAEWAQAGQVPALAALFAPPPPPPTAATPPPPPGPDA